MEALPEMLAFVLSTLLLVTPAPDTSWKHQTLRSRMVEQQIEARGLSHPGVLNAMRAVPRHRFAPDHDPELAYSDRPLPIGHNQTISQPYIVARMTELIRPDSTDRVLEIGTGSGYQAAVLAELVDSVYTIEILPELASMAADRLQRLTYENVVVKNADGFEGWSKHAPYDGIVVTAAPEKIPPPLVRQLADGGRMIIPVGPSARSQRLTLVQKENGKVSTRELTPVRFVPFLRDEN